MPINHAEFFHRYRQTFGPLNSLQVTGLNFLLDRFGDDAKWNVLRHRAYALATVKHETANTYQPIEERGSKVYLSKYYLKGSLRRALGNTKLSDAWVYKGRGYVQITGRANYSKFDKLLAIPLLSNPELALSPLTAYHIMTVGMHGGLFTGKRLLDYLPADPTKPFSYHYARKIINRLDQAGKIADDAARFEMILRGSEA